MGTWSRTSKASRLVNLPGGGGYVIASAQNVADPDNSFFVVYDRVTNAYVRSVRVTAGARSDDCDRTDGITATPKNLGAPFAHGIFVCQDNNNDAPGTAGNQNFKYVPLQAGGRPRCWLAGCALQYDAAVPVAPLRALRALVRAVAKGG